MKPKDGFRLFIHGEAERNAEDNALQVGSGEWTNPCKEAVTVTYAGFLFKRKSCSKSYEKYEFNNEKQVTKYK